jgi:hypothetical protein
MEPERVVQGRPGHDAVLALEVEDLEPEQAVRGQDPADLPAIGDDGGVRDVLEGDVGIDEVEPAVGESAEVDAAGFVKPDVGIVG